MTKKAIKCASMWLRFALTIILSSILVAPPVAIAENRSETQKQVVLNTSFGAITLELNVEKAPRTVDNFLQYVRDGHYNGTIFHRVIDGFMIQGGGFDQTMQTKPTRPAIPLESRNGLKNLRGSIAMARTSQPDSATSQFFINVVDNPSLDFPSFDGHGYAVFGRVISGLEVIDKIRRVPTGAAGPHQNVPLNPILIKSAEVK